MAIDHLVRGRIGLDIHGPLDILMYRALDAANHLKSPLDVEWEGKCLLVRPGQSLNIIMAYARALDGVHGN